MKRILSLLIVIFFYACQSNDPDFINNPDFKTDRYGQFKIDTLFAVKDSTFFADTVNTNNASRLSMARMGGMSAGFVVKYLDLPADTVDVTAARLRLTTLGHFGDEGDDVMVDMYNVTALWDAKDNINGETIWHENPPISFLKTVTFTLQDSGVTEIEIEPSLIKTWQGNDSLNYGFYFTLNPSENNRNVEIGARSSAFGPQLVYAYNDTSDTVKATNDATIFDYDRENGIIFNENGGYLASGIAMRYLLRFDLSQISEKAIIYNANLAIPYDPDFSYRNPNKTEAFTFKAYEDFNADDQNPGYALNMYTGSGVTRVSNQPALATDFIQPMRNGDISHQWFALQFTSESDVFSAMHFYGVDSDKKPMLIIKYLEK
ncbi:MAG: hypothetical protein D6677_00090 [Calditrichaeota bacterium]|nr:MAG: hypothetical protein D6677_00090 [Calditrichota bacterium]